MTDMHLSHKWRSVQETPKHWPPPPFNHTSLTGATDY
jgi:hypothetical protein